MRMQQLFAKPNYPLFHGAYAFLRHAISFLTSDYEADTPFGMHVHLRYEQIPVGASIIYRAEHKNR
jgi:hypothetical protein